MFFTKLRIWIWMKTSRGFKDGERWKNEGRTISNKPFAGSQVSDNYYHDWHRGYGSGPDKYS